MAPPARKDLRTKTSTKRQLRYGMHPVMEALDAGKNFKVLMQRDEKATVPLPWSPNCAG